MKKKVGELYDKPIVIGNPNEFNKNEIALSDLIGNQEEGPVGGESFDDGMVYFKLENPSIFEGIEDDFCVSCIVENEDGNRVLMKTSTGHGRIAIQTSNKMIDTIGSDRTMLESLIYLAFQYGFDFLNEPTIKQITAEEYYSLIKN